MGEYRYLIRNYRPTDYDTYVNLYLDAAKGEPTRRCLSPRTLDEALRRPGYSPETDLFLAEGKSGLVGFMNLTPELRTGRVVLDCLIHPQYRHRGLSRQLLVSAMERARELGARVVHIGVGQDNAAAAQALPRLGFHIVRRFLELRLHLAQALLPAGLPDGYTSQHLSPGEEDILTRLQNRCFADTWGYNPNTVEEITYTLNLSDRSPRDVILICQEDEIVGYCWTQVNCPADIAAEQHGRIFMLGVDPDHRGKGIGKIALRAGLGYLRDHGVDIAELTVDSENQAAYSVYRWAGFELQTRTLYYEKALA
jgi:mycothiol synthase